MTSPAGPALLLVGGLDPTGQSGLARDLAACAALGVHGCPVATGLTVQTSDHFAGNRTTPPEHLEAQLEAAITEHGVRWMKVGALWTAQQVRTVADAARRHDLRVVLDPVLGSSSGHAFLSPAGVDALRDWLPEVELATPNADEDHVLGTRARATLLTAGGFGPDELHHDGRVASLPATHRPGRHRGTGCRLATHTAARLALGLPLEDAVRAAHAALQTELALDGAEQAESGARLAHLREAQAALPRLLAELRYEHLPEVGTNFAYALPGATDPRRDVAGLAGRITIAGFGSAHAGRVCFGGPHHTGRIAVVLQEYDPDARMVLNHRFDEAFLEAARRGGLVDVGFRREDEPPEAPSSMEWGVRDCVRRNGGRVPDLVWDRGGVGKEAMIRVVARDPDDMLRKLRAMHDVAGVVGDADGREFAGAGKQSGDGH